MSAVLFVTNGHGEAAIAQRIGGELRSIVPEARLDHLALVGDTPGEGLNPVGPRRAMPSGGLIAMGNVRNLMRDLGAGLLGLTWAQARFLRGARGRYDAVVAIGDVYALFMALLARAPAVFVGSAKSVAVAPYGKWESRVVARAAAAFVRDDATAAALSRRGVVAEAANTIVDLFPNAGAPAPRAADGFSPALALFPGSRDGAYDDGAFLIAVTGALAATRPRLGAVLSIAPGLDCDRFEREARRAGWEITRAGDASIPFVLRRDGRDVVRAWRGSLGPLIATAEMVLGQAGTANEAAAAAGVPVVAFESDGDRKGRWYRERQQGLLGEALAVFPRHVDAAAAGVAGILDDPVRRARMGATGRARMGPSGGARRVAERAALLMRTQR